MEIDISEVDKSEFTKGMERERGGEMTCSPLWRVSGVSAFVENSRCGE